MSATPSTCCTCARVLSAPSYTSSSSSTSSLSASTLKPDSSSSPSPEKAPSKSDPDAPPSYTTTNAATTPSPQTPPRRLPCCQRLICPRCLSANPRFTQYCPFCQVSSAPSSLPPGGLRDPPGYDSLTDPTGHKKRHPTNAEDPSTEHDIKEEDEPPAYATLSGANTAGEGPTPGPQHPDALHHLHPTDTLPSLSLRYSVPLPVLRQHNGLFTDGLLPARRTVLIPASHYRGPSLSAEPVGSPEEVERKARIRRFMVRTKCHEYEVAELYLGSCGGDVERAVEGWEGDERWERENPIEGARRGKGRVRRGGLGAGLTGQLR